MTTQE